MGFDGTEREEQFVGDLLVGQSLSHEFEHFMFAFAESQLVDSGRIEREWFGVDDDRLSFGEFESCPDAETSENQCQHAEVELELEVADEVTILEKF